MFFTLDPKQRPRRDPFAQGRLPLSLRACEGAFATRACARAHVQRARGAAGDARGGDRGAWRERRPAPRRARRQARVRAKKQPSRIATSEPWTAIGGRNRSTGKHRQVQASTGTHRRAQACTGAHAYMHPQTRHTYEADEEPKREDRTVEASGLPRPCPGCSGPATCPPWESTVTAAAPRPTALFMPRRVAATARRAIRYASHAT